MYTQPFGLNPPVYMKHLQKDALTRDVNNTVWPKRVATENVVRSDIGPPLALLSELFFYIVSFKASELSEVLFPSVVALLFHI